MGILDPEYLIFNPQMAFIAVSILAPTPKKKMRLASWSISMARLISSSRIREYVSVRALILVFSTFFAKSPKESSREILFPVNCSTSSCPSLMLKESIILNS